MYLAMADICVVLNNLLSFTGYYLKSQALSLATTFETFANV